MATIGEVNAVDISQSEKMETLEKPYILYFGVFFDGTSNNMVQKEAAKKIRKKQEYESQNKSQNKSYYERELIEDDKDNNFINGANQTVDLDGNYGVNKSDEKGYSNVGILHSLYQGLSKEDYPENKEVRVFNIYVEGAGSKVIMSDSTSDRNFRGIVNGSGKTGIVYLVSKALEMALFRITQILETIPKSQKSKTEIKFDVFGFSRGAACARLFSYCIANPEIILSKSNLPCIDEFLHSYLSKRYIKNKTVDLFDYVIKQGININQINVEMLGIFDTVCSVGGVKLSSYSNNTTEYGLWSPQLNRVKNTLHICAMDEFRCHFGLTDIGTQNINHCSEIFIPGCHSDVGGGFINGDEKFLIQYAAKEVSIENGRPIKGIKHLQIAKDNISSNSNNSSIDFIYYLRNYGFLGETDTKYEANNFWGKVNDGYFIEDSNGIQYKDAVITRKSIAGYCNIPLRIMIDRSEKDTNRKIFRSPDPLFKIDNAILEIFGKDELELLINTPKNCRKFYYPDKTYGSDKYKKLRKYLHFSAQWYTGNDMYFEGGLVRRILYHGDINDTQMRSYVVYNQ